MGDLVRVRVLVPLSYCEVIRRSFGQDGQKRLADDVQARVEALGFGGSILTMHDPTDQRIVSVLTRPRGARRSSDGVVQILDVSPVEEPPPAPKTLTALQLGRSSYEDRSWDAGLTKDEVWAISIALRSESDPRHLTGFASTLEPSFPVAASLLRVRSAALEPGAEPKAVDPPSPDLKRIDALRAAVDRFAASQGMPYDLVREETQKAVCMLVHNPTLELGGPIAGVPPPIAELAGVLVADRLTRRSGPAGGREMLRVADGEAIRRAFPPTGREGYISPSALQLALATHKPKMSGVGRAPRAFSLSSEIAGGEGSKADRIEVLKAQASLYRAQRALERGRWVEWYRRTTG